MHGPWEFYRKDGSLMRSGEFNRGAQIGIWRTYDRGGNLVSEKKLG
jgi:antitoxin component YwqK of YwqJK toxin-antitoxin module